MTLDEYRLRSATEDDWPNLSSVLSRSFHEEWDDEGVEVEHSVFEPARTVLATLGPDIVASAGSYTRDLTVPGGTLPSAHVSMVAVLPTHRRQGLLRAMMSELFTQARQRGEPVAHLWASEGTIYQRYGYGLAVRQAGFTAVREAQLRQPPPGSGRLRDVSLAHGVPADLPTVYERVRVNRPGWSSRDDRWWRRVLADPKSWRDGATSIRLTVHEGQSGVDGYALWRVKDGASGSGTVRVREVVATDPASYQDIWHFLLTMDLTRTVQFWHACIDEPLAYLVNHPRLLTPSVTDALWVRLLDVPTALAGRRYPVEVDVTLEVFDETLPENTGTWRLTGGPDGASCTRTDSPADLQFDLGALGAAYLGGTSLGTLAAAGRITELTAGTLGRASAAFGWHQSPSATETF